MESLRKLILAKYPDFIEKLDINLKIFCASIRKELRGEGHVVLGITGYPGKGKSNAASIIGMLIDPDYTFDQNISFIPTSKDIEQKYMGLKIHSYLHIDEASRSLHKHKWHERIQQKLNELYDTEREGHFLCTALLMPRFQNFTENFRNFMITYWVHIQQKGIAIFYKKDEDKDVKDPWHMDENYKKKTKKWGSKRIFDRTIADVIRTEQITDGYWFYCEIPPIPKEIWEMYQQMKKDSRVEAKESEHEIESYKDKIQRERLDRWNKISELKSQGLTNEDIGARLGLSGRTVYRNLKDLEAYNKMIGRVPDVTNNNNIIYNHIEGNDSKVVKEEINN